MHRLSTSKCHHQVRHIPATTDRRSAGSAGPFPHSRSCIRLLADTSCRRIQRKDCICHTQWPFGLTNTPAVFQRLMQKVISGLNPDTGPDFVAVYIDDILVFSRTVEEHLEHLRAAIQRIEEAGLKLQPAKCHFARREVEYLGHRETPEGLKTNQRLVEAVTMFQTPTDVNGVRRFLGMASYYRRFIEGFARIAAPLRELTRKNAVFNWTDACKKAMATLKETYQYTSSRLLLLWQAVHSGD